MVFIHFYCHNCANTTRVSNTEERCKCLVCGVVNAIDHTAKTSLKGHYQGKSLSTMERVEFNEYIREPRPFITNFLKGQTISAREVVFLTEVILEAGSAVNAKKIIKEIVYGE